MKKLMLIAALVAAVAANAADFKWGAANLYDGYNSGTAGYTAAKVDGLTGYLIFAQDLSQTDALKAFNASEFSTVTDAAAHSYTFSNGAVSATKTVFEYDATVDSAYDAYFVVFTADNKYMYMSAMKEDVLAVATGEASFSFGNQATASQTLGTGAGTWNAAAVPEPTSGVLLLLGMGALALRRRRA